MEFILKNKTLGKENVVPDLPDMTSGITNVLTNYNATVRTVKPVKLQNSHQSRFKSVSVTSHAHYRPDNAITVRKTTKDDSKMLSKNYPDSKDDINIYNRSISLPKNSFGGSKRPKAPL